MTTASPENLMKILQGHISTLQDSAPIPPDIRRQMWEDLSDIYNYLSGLNRQPSFERVIRSQSAHLDKQQKESEKERSLLKEHRAFVETNIEKADQYLRTIQIAGYTAFFAMWGFTQTHIDPTWAKIALLLMILSAIVFIGWEIWKATILSLSLKRHASITSDAEIFVRNRMEAVVAKNMTIKFQTHGRFIVWIFCICTSSVSTLIIIVSILTSLFS